MKDQRINVRVAEIDKKALTEVSQKLDIPVAIIVREAVKEKIAELTEKIDQQHDIALQS